MHMMTHLYKDECFFFAYCRHQDYAFMNRILIDYFWMLLHWYLQFRDLVSNACRVVSCIYSWKLLRLPYREISSMYSQYKSRSAGAPNHALICADRWGTFSADHGTCWRAFVVVNITYVHAFRVFVLFNAFSPGVAYVTIFADTPAQLVHLHRHRNPWFAEAISHRHVAVCPHFQITALLTAICKSEIENRARRWKRFHDDFIKVCLISHFLKIAFGT